MSQANSSDSLTRDSILRILAANRDLLRRHGVRRIGLFGSFAAGTQSADSDIDFLVEFSEPTYDNFVGLAEALETVLGRKVDLLTPDGLDSIRVPDVKASIRKSLVYG